MDERQQSDAPGPEHLLAGAGVAAYRWTIATDALEWYGAPQAVLGVAADEMSTGARYARFIDPTGPQGRREAVMADARTDDGSGVAYEAVYRFHPPGDDREQWVEDFGRWYGGEDGRPARAEGLVRIVCGRIERDASLRFRSDHDVLTGGLNRSRLVEALDEALGVAMRDQASCALAVIAVDNLGALNDAYGYDAGDELIAGAAARIARELRRGDSLGRIAGNKIAVVLNACTEADLRTAGDRFIRAVAAAPMSTPLGAAGVTISIGGTILPRHARSAGDALARAQEALSLARRRGAGTLGIHQPAPTRDAERRHNIRLAADVISALNAGRIGIALQPVVRADDAEPAFHEALSRLRCGDGEVEAGAFISIAERLGIIRLVDHRMLELALAALAGDRSLSVSVNVSAGSATDGTWFANLAAHARRHGADVPRRLIVEITESMALDDLDRAVDFVTCVRDLGCRVAIDDFGAGHTSFRSLRALGADMVKIDGSFIENIAANTDNLVFVTSLVTLARHMGMQTVAERVTERRDADVLRDVGVDYLQGHLFGRAEPFSPANGSRGAASA